MHNLKTCTTQAEILNFGNQRIKTKIKKKELACEHLTWLTPGIFRYRSPQKMYKNLTFYESYKNKDC